MGKMIDDMAHIFLKKNYVYVDNLLSPECPLSFFS